MKKSLLGFALAYALALPLQAQGIAQKPHIEVQGHAEKALEPDEIFIQVTLSEKDSKGKVPISEQEKELLKIARDLKIPKRDLTLAAGKSHYTPYFWRKNQNETVKVYRLKTQSAQQASQLLYELDRAAFGHARITGVARSDAREVLKALEVQAIKNAKARAQGLLESIGSSLGRPLKVVQRRAYPPLLGLQNGYARKGTGPKSDNPYETAEFRALGFKKITLQSDIELWFEIE